MAQTRKHSRKRDAILECIRSTDCHPTADWIFSQLKPVIPDLSLGTVYRNLTMFKEEGLIQSVGVVNGLERFDRTVEPHIHLVCTNCGSVTDVHDMELPPAFCHEAEEKAHASVSGWNLQLYGVCKDCKEHTSN